METANQRFRQIRNKYKLKQAEFAERLGLTHKQVTNIENNHTKVSFEIAQKIQEVFPKEDWTWLLSGKRSHLPLDMIQDPEIQEFISLLMRAKNEGDLDSCKAIYNRVLGMLTILEKQRDYYNMRKNESKWTGNSGLYD